MLRLVLAAALAAPAAFAQDVSLLVLQDLPVSTFESSVSQIASAAPSANPYVLRHNPSFLAEAGERPALRFATSVAPQVFGSDNLLIGSSAVSIGIAAGEIGGGDLQLGLGGSYSEYRLENILLTDDTESELGLYSTEEREIGGGLAFGWDGPIHVRIGGAAFYRESIEVPGVLDVFDLDRDRVVTLDLGTAISYPVLRGPRQPDETAPRLDVTGAFVYHNVPLSEDYYERPTDSPFPVLQGAPPAEAQTAGVGARYALVRQLGRRGEFRIVEAGVSAQNEFRPDADRSGLQATVVLAEILALRAGRSSSGERGSTPENAVGAELRIGGLIRAIGAAQKSASMLALADRLTMRFEASARHIGADFPETRYYGLTLGWRP